MWRQRSAMLIGQVTVAWTVTALCAAAAVAHSTGETGHSGKQGPSCNACHGGGTAPIVRFVGPDAVSVGDTATYRFEVESMRAAQKAAGFNVAASAGALGTVGGQDEQRAGGELTHTKPKANVDMVAGWEFSWTAPGTTGPVTLFGAGNSVNRNGQSSGDRADTTTFVIQVLAATATPTATSLPATPTHTAPPPPTPTRTETPTTTATRAPATPTSTASRPPHTATPTTAATTPPPATPTETETAAPGTPMASASPSTTPSASPPAATPTVSSERCVGDCDGDRIVAVNELVVGVGIALGAQPVEVCRADDLDGDGRVGISELIAAVTSALDGCS